uniref:Lincomycin resistance protein LmrB n=1 Tax=uncultured bacterium Contig1772 TaxID=1393512 RepID=W0FJS7_9BACT|nr:lincomycin resistance protein LmrB [uncultured bacterium Contig1772]
MQAAVLLAGCLIVVLNYTLLAPALPVIMHEMSVDEPTVQWLTSVYAMVEAIIIPMNAFLLGRFSVRKLFTGAFVLFTVGSFAAAVAPTFSLLLVARVLQAMATGVAMPMVWTLLLLMAPKENRGVLMGLVGVVISFAPAIGPPASGAIIDAFGWRSLFFIVSGISVAVIVFTLALLKNRDGFERTSFDAPSMVLSSFGMFFLLYGLSTFTSTETPWLSALLMVAGIVLLGVFVRRQGKLEVPMLRVETLKTRRFRNAIIVCCLLEGALIAVDVLLPLFLQNSLGQTPTATGLIMAPAALAGAVTGVVAGRVFDKRGVRRIVLVGAVLLEGSAIALCLCGAGTWVVLVAGIYCIETIGWQCVSTPTNTWGINSLPNEIIQHGNAVMSTLMQVGASFGTAALVSLTAFGPLVVGTSDAAAATLAGYHVAFVGTAILLGVVALVLLVGVRNKAGDDGEQG